MRIGSFEIKVALEYQIWEGRSLKYRLNSLDEAIDLADELWEEDREREERAQYGDGRNGNIADRRWKHRHEEAV
jgi:hypothetical protein